MGPAIEIVTPDQNRPFRAWAHQAPTLPRYWHQHAEYELLAVVAGDGERHLGDRIDHVQAPQVLLISPQVAHAWTTASPYVHLVVQFRHDWLGADFFATPGCEKIAAMLARPVAGLVVSGAAARELIAEMRALLPQVGLPAITALLRCLDHFAAAKPQPIGGTAEAPDQRLQRILAWITERAHHDLSLASVAEEMAMHPQAFARYFRRASGQAFLDYLRHTRIGIACNRLRESDESITHIAMHAGFGTIASFNRAFLRLRGMTPSEYRRRCRGEENRS